MQVLMVVLMAAQSTVTVNQDKQSKVRQHLHHYLNLAS
jgi:hypothetical protein